MAYEYTGITIGENRTSMVEGRLRKRVRSLDLSSYEGYLDVLAMNPDEKRVFIDLITTNETSFFRTPRIWEYIENTLLPEWFDRYPAKTFLAWSAAASSGEEAYSLCILCQEFKEKNPRFNYKILGTDISNEVILKCEAGAYSGRSIENFKNRKRALFNKYMIKKDEETYSVIPEIRSRLSFKVGNLFDTSLTTDVFNLVLVRNVLIYFTAKDQERVLSLIVPRMCCDGTLIIGESESLSHISNPFKFVQPLIYHPADRPLEKA